MKVDLHTHTTASDGLLAPADLVARARGAGVDVLAITDHDTVAGIAPGLAAAQDMRIIPGIELSTTWRNIGIHVLGLNIDIEQRTLLDGVAAQQAARAERAELIAKRLSRLGYTDTLAGAQDIAGTAAVGRPHFARFLVDSGQVKDVSTAFRRLLGRGKPGDVRNTWAALPEVIGWIRAAGGVAVLAHPAKYKLTNLKLTELAREFSAAGGTGMEVVSGTQQPSLTSRLARLAQREGLLASAGSDFHRPGEHWAEIGSAPALPADCAPIWSTWQD